VTKPASNISNVTKRHGRPRVGTQPMTGAERQRRHRAAKARPIKDADEVYRALVSSRGLVSAFDRTLAKQITNLLVEGRVLEAVKGLEHLPPVVRAEVHTRTTGESKAHERVLQMIMSAVAADRQELAERAARGEQLSEADQLRLRLQQIEDAEAEEDEADRTDGPNQIQAGESATLAEAQRRIQQLEDENLHLRGVKPRAWPPPFVVRS